MQVDSTVVWNRHLMIFVRRDSDLLPLAIYCLTSSFSSAFPPFVLNRKKRKSYHVRYFDRNRSISLNFRFISKIGTCRALRVDLDVRWLSIFNETSSSVWIFRLTLSYIFGPLSNFRTSPKALQTKKLIWPKEHLNSWICKKKWSFLKFSWFRGEFASLDVRRKRTALHLLTSLRFFVFCGLNFLSSP